MPLLSRVIISLSTILLCVSTYSSAQSGLSPLLTRQLDSIAVQDVPAKAPGIATAVISNGQLLYEKYAGYADFADSSLIGTNTRFNIASNGKQFTALAILELIDAGKIHLKDDIRKYFPSLFTGIAAPITLEHLLTHTSGIRDVYDLWSLQGLTWWKQSFSNQDVLALLQQQKALNFTPGTQYLYSNSNYILLASLVEKISGRSFTEAMRILFRKLGMHHTAFEDDYTAIKGPIARAYFNFSTWTTYQWIWNVCGDGNLFTTLRDQVQWELVIQGKINTPVKKKIIEASQQLIDPTLTRQYGYGLEFGQYKQLPYTFHEGATGAWKATVLRFPAQKLSLITLTNTGKSIPSMQTRQMADVLLSMGGNTVSFLTKPAAPGKYISEPDITGIYLTDNNFSFQFSIEKGNLLLKRSGRNDIVLEREADNIFHQKNDPAFKQEFTLTDKGEMKVTAYYTTHAPYSLTRPAVNWNDFQDSIWTGVFVNDETGVELSIEKTGEKNYRLLMSDNRYNGMLATPVKLLAGNYTLQLSDKHTVLLDGERIKKIIFRRIR